jgi:quinol monooxygenase YgiN
MYGTVARLRAKEGMSQQVRETLKREESRHVEGLVAVHIYEMDNNSDEFILVVMFDSKESYRANAESTAQHQSYMRLIELLDAPPEWSDGFVVFSHTP